MSASKIEWTQRTWNPIVGCSVTSPGCTHCYAMRQAHRLAGNPATPHYAGTTKMTKGGPVFTGKVAPAPRSVLLAPLERKKPTTWFVNSMGDLFHESVPDEWIDQVFAVMALCPQHTFQVLTKRAARMQRFMSRPDLLEAIYANWSGFSGAPREIERWPLPNVWLGVSAERQAEADERIPLLLRTPAAVRFVSCEPLLSPVDLTNLTVQSTTGQEQWNCLDRVEAADAESGSPDTVLDWVIAGGESGPGARPMHPAWARGLRDQCKADGTPFFFKQWGAWAPISFNDLASEEIESEEIAGNIDGFHDQPMHRVGKQAAGRLLDGELHDAMPATAMAAAP